MNCGECGRKMIVINGNDGVIIYCPVCHPDLDKAFSLGKRLPEFLKREKK
jgi:hypothetical protein